MAKVGGQLSPFSKGKAPKTPKRKKGILPVWTSEVRWFKDDASLTNWVQTVLNRLNERAATAKVTTCSYTEQGLTTWNIAYVYYKTA